MTEKKPVCCLCGRECDDEWGNNPWPLSLGDDDRCCNACNTEVITARLCGAERIARELGISLGEAREKAESLYEHLREVCKARGQRKKEEEE